MSPPKVCAVCGDKALGYNFNAVTCESCKAFFRRNALAKKHFTCPFSQNCEITVVTRRFCQKCRLKKCVDIGMKSENIMTEEDKLIKRRKIESNREKRRLNEQKHHTDENIKEIETEKPEQQQQAADSSGIDANTSIDSQSCCSFDSASANNNVQCAANSTTSSSPTSVIAREEINPELMTSEEMVEFIVRDPDRASQAISKFMRTPKEAMVTMEKIINSQKDALKLIQHLIAYPGDALKIISKLMNSPLNALNVFTKFMSSPTDALEIISKIVDSPQDVLQFIRNLMDSPEDALHIMNKFMNTPAEALKMINKIFNGSNAPAASSENKNNNNNNNNDTPPAVVLENTSPFHLPISPQSQVDSPITDNTLLNKMLDSSPSERDLTTHTPPYDTTIPPPPIVTPFTPSPQAMSLTSPISITTNDLQYNSPLSLPQEEFPSTSTTLLTSSPANITHEAEFDSQHFDFKSLMQNTFAESTGFGDSMNSFESVLSEVIRIEYLALNSSPQERIKQEQYGAHLMCGHPHDFDDSMMEPQRLPQQQISSPSNIIVGRDLNEAEQHKLRELRIASEALYIPVNHDISLLVNRDGPPRPGDNTDSKLLQIINLTAVGIKRLIKMAKKLSAFRDMCQEDQVALLKGGCTEMMLMRSVVTYDYDRHTWMIPHVKESMANIHADVLKLANDNLYEEHLNFLRSFDVKWRNDDNIMLIILAIVLFTPTRDRVIHSDVIRLEQNSYYYLLRRYLESIYPGCEAKSNFIKLVQKISDVDRLNQNVIGVYLNVNPVRVEPLLREIFDLKAFN
ncbi:nuclear hormone receptor HR96 [Teleopsis dalmanni]|uniref:nuclear hormone receptor HR96 n=1 Tax=Teleopsis dalmanni TaxID=139649 RepID=UPI0018CE9F4C|nr:nuclear hormone receptor HR96 [Teleopsis dalmanni]